MDTRADGQQLADPEQRPGADVVIFDGHCRFCTGQARRLAGWDQRGRLAFLSLHDARVSQLCPDLTHEQLMVQMYLVTPSGTRYAGAAVIRYLSRALPRLWPLAPLLHIPGSLPLWQWLYSRVAKRRYRYGASDSCESDSCDAHFK